MAKRIPEHKVEEIYQAVDIVEVVSDYMPLKKKGQNHWALSPFSQEKTPSFAVSAQKGIFKDFSSGKGGNAVAFLMEMEGYTYPEALRALAKKYGIELEEEELTDEEKQQQDKRQSLFVVNAFAARFFQQQLHESEEGRRVGLSYFKERGLLKNTMETFGLGYAPESWDSLLKAARDQQYRDEYLEELGLVAKSDKTGNLYDRFRNRIIFPIYGQTGKILGFGGRVLSSEKQMAKYINSPESPIYHKSEVLYGLYQGRQHIRNEDRCILVEGYMDVLLLHQSGIRNVVASSGTALTPEQVRLIRRFSSNVLMIYDGDAPGIKAALRGIDILVEQGLSSKVLVLPDGHDPDSYVRAHGADHFRTYAEAEAKNFIDFKLDVLRSTADASDPSQQAQILRDLAETLARIPDRIQRELFVKHTAERLDVGEGLMAGAVAEAQGVQLRQQRREARRVARTQPPQAEVKALKAFETLDLANQEKELLRVLLNHFDQILAFPTDDPERPRMVPLVQHFTEELEELAFENGVYESLKQHLFSLYRAGKPLNIDFFTGHQDRAVSQLATDLITPPYELSKHWLDRGSFKPDYDPDIQRTATKSLDIYRLKKLNQLVRDVREELDKMQVEGINDPERSHELLEMLLFLYEKRKPILEKHSITGAWREI